MIIETYPGKVLKTHVLLIVSLLIANVAGIVYTIHLGQGQAYGIVPLFDFDTEKNIPTFFSSVMMVLCSVVLFLIAMNNKKAHTSFIPWLGLSFVFLFLSIDEFSSIHERFIVPTRNALNATGFLYFAWVIPYGLALIVFVLAYTKFLFKLPKNIALLFLASGITFVAGAIGFEMLGSKHAETAGAKDLVFSILYTFEELLEMLGIALFLFAILTYVSNQLSTLTITVAEKKEGE